MDGFALCRAVKSHPDTAAIPFVFYTATYTTPPDIQLAEELGATLFLVKPLDPEALIAHIHRILPQTDSSPTAPIPAVNETRWMQSMPGHCPETG
jgi:CheY-like chemotaxis protein